MALKYLERVLRNPHGRHLDEHLDQSVKLVVLSALLHDIGHYPYYERLVEMAINSKLNQIFEEVNS